MAEAFLAEAAAKTGFGFLEIVEEIFRLSGASPELTEALMVSFSHRITRRNSSDFYDALTYRYISSSLQGGEVQLDR